MKTVRKFLFEYYLLDLLQITQYSIIALFLSVIFSVINRTIFKLILYRSNKSIIIEFIYICIQTIVIIITLILIKSLMNNIPSLANKININYDGTYALVTSTHITMFFALIELIPSYKYLFEDFSKRIKISENKYIFPKIV